MRLTWIRDDEPLPDPATAWDTGTEAPGLLAVGGQLSVPRLLEAYRKGIFPWYGENQPVLWWSPDPRMVLDVDSFRLHRSLRKTLARFNSNPAAGEVRFDTAFDQVIENCAHAPRVGQSGTWIVPAMREAYRELHRAGFAHSVETWVHGELCGGLYCVAIGKSVFGESMFAHATDASKIALAALVAFCRGNGIQMIDCQQNTAHLASLGAGETSRTEFLRRIEAAAQLAAPRWEFDPVYWRTILST